MIKVNCGSIIVFRNVKDFSELFNVTVKTVESWITGQSKPRRSYGIKSIQINDNLIKF